LHSRRGVMDTWTNCITDPINVLKSNQVHAVFNELDLYDVDGPGSSVGTATDYGLDGPGIESR
jgi:hypothetical protein